MRQQDTFLKNSSLSGLQAPALMHVLAGSIQAQADLFTNIRQFLGFLPKSADNEKVWDLLRKQNKIEFDGFVQSKHRNDIMRALPTEYNLAQSPFLEVSPAAILIKYYSEARHLGSELSTSTLGHLLGAAEVMFRTGKKKKQELSSRELFNFKIEGLQPPVRSLNNIFFRLNYELDLESRN